MPLDPLNDIVLFELPARSGATQLLAELSSSRLAWIGTRRRTLPSSAFSSIRTTATSLYLLRTVETWSNSAGCFDRAGGTGGLYVLQPTLTAQTQTAA
jgi:hypothetical protein